MTRPKHKKLIDLVVTAFLWCWYGVADRVRLWLARKKWQFKWGGRDADIGSKHWENDLVSIIMPTIGRNVTAAIDSILWQTHKNWELIIVGDGVWPEQFPGHKAYSPQMGEERIAQIYHYRIVKIVHYPTDDPKYQWLAGPCRAINYGLSRARGDWIARIDDDDVWNPKHLERALEAAKNIRAEFVSFSIDLNGERPKPDRFYGRSVGSVQSWVYRSYLKCFKANLHCWRKGWNAVNDVDLAQRMARAGVKMKYFIDPYPHAYIEPRDGLTEIGIKGWLQERAKDE